MIEHVSFCAYGLFILQRKINTSYNLFPGRDGNYLNVIKAHLITQIQNLRKEPM